MNADQIAGLFIIAASAAMAFVATIGHLRNLNARAEENRRRKDYQAFVDMLDAANDAAADAFRAAKDETPIHTATAAHIARHEAAAIDDEWAWLMGDDK